jgi:hypothetical protein
MKKRKQCIARTPGNVLTSYPCSRYAQAGRDYCYWHDPETSAERMERTRRQTESRRLEREARYARLRAEKEQEGEE